MEAIKKAGELARCLQVDGVQFFVINGKETLLMLCPLLARLNESMNRNK